MDSMFTNGIIAVKEKSLLGDRIKRYCEGSADDAFRQIAESGFGSGSEALSARDYELLIAAEERAIDKFIREFAPSNAELRYLFYPRDFHNAEALVKAECLSLDVHPMLASEGTVAIGKLTAAVQSGDVSDLGILGESVKEALSAFRDEDRTPTGSEIGAIFSKALYKALKKDCYKNKATKALISAKADMTNILTAFRSPDRSVAENLYVEGGTLEEKELANVFLDGDRLERAFARTPYASFVHACLEAKRSGLPYTQAERMLANYEIESFSQNRFSLNGSQTFLYYVFRRRLECEDVRIMFVCLNAGMQEGEIKKRLRSVREGL